MPSSTSRSFPETADTLGARLRSPYLRMQQVLYAGLEPRHPAIRRSHSAVFRHLSAEGSRLTDLAEQAGMTKQSMAALVDHLAASGYVKTVRHPGDGRAVLVKPSAKGRSFIADALAASAELERRAETVMGKAGVRRLRQLLAQLDDAWTGSADA